MVTVILTHFWDVIFTMSLYYFCKQERYVYVNFKTINSGTKIYLDYILTLFKGYEACCDIMQGWKHLQIVNIWGPVGRKVSMSNYTAMPS